MTARKSASERDNEPPIDDRVFIKISDLIVRWSLCRSKIYELMDAGLLDSVKIGKARRVLLASAKELEASLVKNGIVTKSPREATPCK